MKLIFEHVAVQVINNISIKIYQMMVNVILTKQLQGKGTESAWGGI